MAQKIMALMILLLVASAYSATKLRLSYDALNLFPANSPVRQSVLTIDKKLIGTMPVELLIDTGAADGATNPVFLKRLDAWLQQLQRAPVEGIAIKSVSSLLDLIKEAHQVIGEEKRYSVPAQQDLVAQELLLLQMDSAGAVAKYTDSGFRYVRVTLTTPWQDAVNYTHFLDAVTTSFQQQFASSATLQVTGMVSIANRIFTEMLNSMAVSYLFSALTVSLAMILLLRSFKLGMGLMFPNLLPIFEIGRAHV